MTFEPGARLDPGQVTDVRGRSMGGGRGLAVGGGGIGLLSGLVGAGGAFIASPFMTWCNVPMHQVVATSAATPSSPFSAA